MYYSYNSDTKILSAKCVKCGKETSCHPKDVSLYSNTPNKGVFITLPVCSCGAVNTTYTGDKPLKSTRCHLNCVLAKAAFTEGALLNPLGEGCTMAEEKIRLEEKLDDLGSRYQDGSVEHRQFLGNERFIFPIPGKAE